MLAAEAEDGVGCVRLLVQARAAVDAADAGGETALIKAARVGHVQTVRLLLAKGARADLRHASQGRSQGRSEGSWPLLAVSVARGCWS